MYNLLIVDDEPLILESLYQMISKKRDRQFVVFKAGSALESLKIFREHRIDLLMTDICLPETNGLKLRDTIQENWPECFTIFLTGQEEFEDVMNRILDEALCRHSADVNAQLADTICEKIGVQLDNVIAEKITEQVSTKVIKEMDYRMRLQDDEAEERFRKLDETLFMRRKKSREQKEAAASRLPWKRKHKT